MPTFSPNCVSVVVASSIVVLLFFLTKYGSFYAKSRINPLCISMCGGGVAAYCCNANFAAEIARGEDGKNFL